MSCRPPATVLAKPAPIRNRKDSSDAEPSPPNSPSYFEEDHESSITVSLEVPGLFKVKQDVDHYIQKTALEQKKEVVRSQLFK